MNFQYLSRSLFDTFYSFKAKVITLQPKTQCKVTPVKKSRKLEASIVKNLAHINLNSKFILPICERNNVLCSCLDVSS